jgi:hypothetical protein
MPDYAEHSILNEWRVYLTYDGRTFKEQSGYVIQGEMDAWKKKIQILKDWLLIVGSLLSGCWALFLSISEGIKIYTEHNKFFCLYLEIATSTILLLSAVLLWRRKSK